MNPPRHDLSAELRVNAAVQHKLPLLPFAVCRRQGSITSNRSDFQRGLCETVAVLNHTKFQFLVSVTESVSIALAACVSCELLQPPVHTYATAVSLSPLQILCHPFDERKSNGQWYGNTQISHKSSIIITIMIVAAPKGRRADDTSPFFLDRACAICKQHGDKLCVRTNAVDIFWILW